MRPTADFACQGKKCRTDEGEAPVYELPIDSTRCPRCSSKRITRLFNKLTVLRGAPQEADPRLTSSSHLVRSTALLRPGFDYHEAHKPGYTPPVDERGYRVDDPARYDKLPSYAVDPQVARVVQPGKGRPLTPLEVMRERKTDPGGAVALIAAQAAVGVPTLKLRSKDDVK